MESSNNPIKKKVESYREVPRPEAWNKVKSKLQKKESKRFSIRRLSIAATVLVLIVAGFLATFFIGDGFHEPFNKGYYSSLQDMPETANDMNTAYPDIVMYYNNLKTLQIVELAEEKTLIPNM